MKEGPGDNIFLLTDRGIWQTGPGRGASRISDIASAVDVISHPDGTLYVLSWSLNGEVVEIGGGRARLLLSLNARPIDLAIRGNVVWASFDRYLAAFRSDEPPELLGPEADVPSGGPLLVDREGSLWMGSYQGLIQYPEPETFAFNDRDGLPSAHTRFLAKTEKGLWVSTWQGLGRLERIGGRWSARNQAVNHIGPFCADSDGTLWAHIFKGDTLRYHKGRFVKLSVPRFTHLYSCASEEGKSMWLATEQGLIQAAADRQARFVTIPPELSESRTVFRDREGRLWVSNEERVCRRDASAINSDQSLWNCDWLPGVQRVTEIIELSGGSLWASTHNAGVWRLANGRWEQIPGSASLPSGRIWGLALSPRGGVWILGDGVYARVIESHEVRDGWEVVERLSAWQGFVWGQAEDLIEEPDGALWIATIGGVVYIPAEARLVNTQPPPVSLVGLFLNGKSAILDQTQQIPSGPNQLEVQFAALSYRDRGLLRYQYRLRPDDLWTDSPNSVPQFRFVDLRPGRYVVEIRASLDGLRWSQAPARFAFEVLSPWYTKWWALTLFALAVVAALYIVYRIRLTVLLRLERQRTRIAMDLHDELGAGLGSIGILSNIVSQGDLDDARRRTLVKKISETSGELGDALTEIVWALRPGSESLESLAYHLTEHAGLLFPGDQTRFSTDLPSRWPAIRLSLAVRRNLQLIALEALHNAASHAGASRVVLGMKQSHRRWQLWVADDGVGLPGTVGSPGRNGMGLANMKRRAEEIGAEISWTSHAGKRTTVIVIFHT